jgi:hypothetical protein
MSLRFLAAFLLAALPAAQALAQFAVVPARPNANDPVVLRMSVDSCVYDQDIVDVRADSNVFRVAVGINACLQPGPTKVIDVRLGTLPVGEYRVEVVRAQSGAGSPSLASIPFTVIPRPVIAVFPPPKKPNADYTGAWWVPTESGWGLSILQSPADSIFAQLFVYGANGAPGWFTFQGGQWKSATRWEGSVYASTGPAFSGPAFDPRQVTIQPIGAATLEFEQVPGSEGIATLTYSVGNVTVTKRIQRLPF